MDVHVSDDMYRYLIDVVESMSDHEHVGLGVSPSGRQALLRDIQVHAIVNGRDNKTLDDVKAMVKPVLGHRLILSPSIRLKENQTNVILDEIITTVPVPTEAQLAEGMQK